MELDDPPGDRQPETRAALLARGGVIDLLKFLEDPLLVGLGDAGARVRHRDDEFTVGAPRLQPHLARLGELDRVADEGSAVPGRGADRRPGRAASRRRERTLSASFFSAARDSTAVNTVCTTSVSE